MLKFTSSASNRIIYAKDHASIQMNIADVDEKTGMALPSSKTYAICGSIRRMVNWIPRVTLEHITNLFSLTIQGESDDCINRLAKKDGVVAKWVTIIKNCTCTQHGG